MIHYEIIILTTSSSANLLLPMSIVPKISQLRGSHNFDAWAEAAIILILITIIINHYYKVQQCSIKSNNVIGNSRDSSLCQVARLLQMLLQLLQGYKQILNCKQLLQDHEMNLE